MFRDTYGFTFAKSHYFDPYAPERKKRLLRAHGTVIEGQPYPVQTSDRVDLRLTRYQGGGKGPVILAPGFGMSSLSFSIDTVRPNLVEYLCDHDYDVWLLDYRASPELAAALTQFSIDEIATRDWPAAVDTVRACADAPTVQVVAHCVGAMAFMMGLLAGSLRGTVRSAVCSQMGVHPIGGLLNEIKAGFYFGTALGFLGWERLRVKVDASADWKGRLFDRLLKFYPTDEPCNNPVCRRVWLFLGESFTHTQLDQATHDALHEMFGEVNLRALRHLARILREGQVVNRDGEDAYLPQADRIDIPIHFLHGEENRIFLPEGTEETLDWLRSRNPGRARLYTRTPPIPGYAHLDCFIGKNAWRDVFPLVLEQLDRYA
jgi:cholesterol oxidase